MEAEIQEAFAEARPRNIPAEHLRPDLPQLETAGERRRLGADAAGGPAAVSLQEVQPRLRRPDHAAGRARRSPPPTAGPSRRCCWTAGSAAWPVNAEVHLYETLPDATHLGHIAQFEGEGAAPMARDARRPAPADAGGGRDAGARARPGPAAGAGHAPSPSSPSSRPGAGRAPSRLRSPAPARRTNRTCGRRWARRRPLRHAARRCRVDPVATHPATSPAYADAARFPAASRYFRLRLPVRSGRPRARPQTAASTSPTTLARSGSIRVHLRLSEQEAQRLAELLQRGNAPAALAWLKHRYQRVLPAVMTAPRSTSGARRCSARR